MKDTQAWRQASANARIFKPVAILCIVFGHFHTMGGRPVAVLAYWWNISAIALIYFTICSAYFTRIKYRDRLDVGEFWANKARRLGAKLVLVNGFLLAVFMARGEDNIWSVHSLVNVLGMTGFLNWFGIQNVSPFGAGLWFLTLLFMFYAVFPWLRGLYDAFPGPGPTLAGVAACLVLDRTVPVGHTLWLTMAGYFVGMFLADSRIRMDKTVALASMAGLLGAFVAFNVFQIKVCNGLFLVLLAVLFFILTMTIAFHRTPLRVLGLLDGAVLEIFMLHTYLFWYPTRMLAPDFMISLAIVCAVAVVLAQLSKRLARAGT